MDLRKALAYRVLVDGMSLSEAAREFGVSRPTARLWRNRACEEGLATLAERSRRPRSCPSACDREWIDQIIDARKRYPSWGAKKLLEILWPGPLKPVSLRTANRVLGRAGLSGIAPGLPQAHLRFERDEPNELWQMDFKGLKYPRLPYEAFCVLDDATRFSLAIRPVRDQTLNSVWRVLWDLFGEHGLPKCLLSDNGSAFRAGAGNLPSALRVRLMRLGVASAHGRPYHPQTQGKVERFNGTLQRELGPALRQPTLEDAARIYECFRSRYNWERPHEALDMRVPGSLYKQSSRLRPDRLPDHEIAPNVQSRKVDDFGNIGFRSRRYKVGRGLAGERVVIQEGDTGFVVKYFNVEIGFLEAFEV